MCLGYWRNSKEASVVGTEGARWRGRQAGGQVVSNRSWAFTLVGTMREGYEQRRLPLASQGKEEARMPGRRHEVLQGHMRLCRCTEVAEFKNIRR